jgi:hypothetical protein
MCLEKKRPSGVCIMIVQKREIRNGMECVSNEGVGLMRDPSHRRYCILTSLLSRLAACRPER